MPRILLLLIMLLVDGCTFMKPSQEALSVAQLITDHAKINRKKTKKQRHRKCQETPLMIYTGLKLFFLTRSRKLIDGLFRIGLCVSYDRVLELTKILYHNLYQAYTNYGCLFPRLLKVELNPGALSTEHRRCFMIVKSLSVSVCKTFVQHACQVQWNVKHSSTM